MARVKFVLMSYDVTVNMFVTSQRDIQLLSAQGGGGGGGRLGDGGHTGRVR